MNDEKDVTIDPITVDFPRAAKMTSLSVNSLRRFARIGKLKTILVGRRRLIPVAALHQLLEESDRAAQAAA
jgi:hypothetical protein